MRLWKVTALVLSVKVYVLVVLYVLFTRTMVHQGSTGLIFALEGRPVAECSAAIEHDFWERLTPYDGQWYRDIAENGYRSFANSPSRPRTAAAGNYAFFPLLPSILCAMRAVGGEGHVPLTIILVACASAAGAVLVGMMARDLRISPVLSVALLLAFPTAVYQVVLYTEGIFLLLSAAALLFALRRRLALAALAGALVGLSRPQGVLLAIPLFVEFLLPVIRGTQTADRKALVARALAVAAPFSGFVVLAVVSATVADSWSSFLSVQGSWGRSYGPWNVATAIGSAAGYGGPRMDLLGLVFGVAVLPLAWRHLPRSLFLYAVGIVLLPLMTGSLLSMGRFLSVSVPHFLALAAALERVPVTFRVGVVGTFATLQVLVANGLLAWCFVG